MNVTEVNGAPVTDANPIPIKAPDGAPLAVVLDNVTVDVGELNILLSHVLSGGVYDSVRIGDGADELAISSAGTIGVDLRVAGAAVSGGNPVPISGTIDVSVGQIDESAFMEGVGQVMPIAGVRIDAPLDDPPDQSAAAVLITAKRALQVNLRDATGAERGTAGSPLRVDVTGSTTQPISAASLPLPTGAATEATLATLLTLAGFQARINTLGQKTMANSTPVVLASDQVAIPVSQSGAWVLGANSGVDIGDVTINNASLAITHATLAVVGGGAEATALRVTIANDSTGVISVDDNGSSLSVDTTQLPAALVGGRLDANIGAWLGSTAPSVGQKAMANSLPVAIASDQASIPVAATLQAGTAIAGAVRDVSGALVQADGTARTPQYAFTNPSSAGATEVVVAQVGAKIRVLAVYFHGNSTAVDVKFQSAASDKTGLKRVGANGGFVLPYNPAGWFETNANEALNVNLSAALACGVDVTWISAT